MSDLLEFAIAARGGIERWTSATTVTATVRVHGVFWGFKGHPDLLGVEQVTADVQRQRITLSPFGPGRTLEFDADADRVRVLGAGGEVVDELTAPRASMAGYTDQTPWTATQTGYFIAYATWMYLLEPYLLTLPGVSAQEVEPWQEAGETWRRLEVTFPESIATHSRVQTYYVDAETGLQRRMDYNPVVNGDSPAAHYTSEHHDFDGLVVPTRRRVLLRDERGIADQSLAAILLDVSDVVLHH